MREILCERIKTERNEKNATQDDVAKILGISRANYGYYENGKSLPPLDKLLALARYFGVSVDYLIGNEEKEPLDIIETLKQITCALEREKKQHETN